MNGGAQSPILFPKPEKQIGIVGNDLTPTEYAAIMTRILDKTVVYNHIPREVFASFGFPGAEDLANMFEFHRIYVADRQADVITSRSLNPTIQTFESWLITNKAKF